jgi:hypothetical protein
MLKKLQPLFKEQALIAHSGVQFLDYGFKVDDNFAFSKFFLEKPDEHPDGPHDVLSLIERTKKDVDNPTKRFADFVDPETGEDVMSRATYSVQLRTVLDAYDSIWLPAPFLKHKGRAASGQMKFEPGPSNWARLRVVKLDQPDEAGFTHRLTLAFDTRPEKMIERGPYACPLPEDVRNQTYFELAPSLRDNSWWLDQKWMKECLGAALEHATKQRSIRRPQRDDGLPSTCSHWSFFAVLLLGLDALLNEKTTIAKTSSAPLPTVRFLNTLSNTTVAPIDVDLVLDIGNSRTCGVLIERAYGGGLSIKDATVLELRDISRPHLAYDEPFRSRVEFVEPWFGNPYYDLASGRDLAFNWPSLARVGPEALRLNGKSSGSLGDTGLSSPKRYLWDERENRQPWYFNRTEANSNEPKPVIGPITELLTQSGDFIDFAPDGRGALQPKFSRASLFSFLVMELILQAVVQMNSPGYRSAREHPNVPRRINRVVFTIPTATPMVERACYERRCLAAIKLLWRSCEWGQPDTGTGAEPKINLSYDEATCTQVVYLYNEIIEKFRKAPRDFFKLVADREVAPNGDRLRVASLDIGGGTTDLMITTYDVKASGDALNPTQNFREGFRRAGDDILEAVISRHVLKPIAAALKRAGMEHPGQFLASFMEPNQSAQTQQIRKLFVTRILVQIALSLLGQYETSSLFAGKGASLTFEEATKDDAVALDHVINFFQEAARKEGATDFLLADAVFELNFVDLGATAASVMRPILSLMCEVIYQFKCDVLLVSGRPSRLPIVRDLLLRSLPTSPNRTVFMHDYRVANWYMFRGRRGTIEDPKTTVVMGALLCALASDRTIADFALNTESFGTRISTANYLGRINVDSTINKDEVILARQGGRFPTQSRQLDVDGSMFLGFRQSPMESWPATPLFALETSKPAEGDWGMPWKVILRRKEISDDPAENMGASETFEFEQVVNKHGDDVSRYLQLRLQTLRDPEGYWLDRGIVELKDE